MQTQHKFPIQTTFRGVFADHEKWTRCLAEIAKLEARRAELVEILMPSGVIEMVQRWPRAPKEAFVAQPWKKASKSQSSWDTAAIAADRRSLVGREDIRGAAEEILVIGVKLHILKAEKERMIGLGAPRKPIDSLLAAGMAAAEAARKGEYDTKAVRDFLALYGAGEEEPKTLSAEAIRAASHGVPDKGPPTAEELAMHGLEPVEVFGGLKGPMQAALAKVGLVRDKLAERMEKLSAEEQAASAARAALRAEHHASVDAARHSEVHGPVPEPVVVTGPAKTILIEKGVENRVLCLEADTDPTDTSDLVFQDVADAADAAGVTEALVQFPVKCAMVVLHDDSTIEVEFI